MSENLADHWDWAVIRERCAKEAARILRRRQDTDEVVQEALVRAWRSRGACRTPEMPLPWCLQITRNEALRLIRRQRASAPCDPLESDDGLEDDRPRGGPERVALRIDVNRALHKLSAPERLLILLRYEYGCSHPQIAATLDIPEATARVRLHRAHKRLQSLLDVS
jgi:RNA polymerase sigma-70 factor (ECF subfamily)